MTPITHGMKLMGEEVSLPRVISTPLPPYGNIIELAEATTMRHPLYRVFSRAFFPHLLSIAVRSKQAVGPSPSRVAWRYRELTLGLRPGQHD